MASGHGVDKPDKAEHPGRKVDRERRERLASQGIYVTGKLGHINKPNQGG